MSNNKVRGPVYDILKFERTSFFLWFKWNSDYYVIRRTEYINSYSNYIEKFETYLSVEEYIFGYCKFLVYSEDCKKFRSLESAKNKLNTITTQYSSVAYSHPDEVFLDPLEAKFEELENSVPKNVPKLVNGTLKWVSN